MHLAFADDIIPFAQGSDDGPYEILTTLKKFCEASGQKINFNKSYIIFNKHATQNFKDHVCSILNITSLGESDTYLGFPFSHTRKQNHLHQPIIQKFTLKIYSWRNNFLSKADRLVMIKSILHAIPLHLMSCLKTPKTICNSMEKLIRQFYWGWNFSNNKIHWIE